MQKLMMLYKKASSDRDQLEKHLRRLLPPNALPVASTSDSGSSPVPLLTLSNLGELVEAQAQVLANHAASGQAPAACSDDGSALRQGRSAIGLRVRCHITVGAAVADLERRLAEKSEVAAMLERKLAKLKAGGGASSPPASPAKADEAAEAKVFSWGCILCCMIVTCGWILMWVGWTTSRFSSWNNSSGTSWSVRVLPRTRRVPLGIGRALICVMV